MEFLKQSIIIIVRQKQVRHITIIVMVNKNFADVLSPKMQELIFEFLGVFISIKLRYSPENDAKTEYPTRIYKVSEKAPHWHTPV